MFSAAEQLIVDRRYGDAIAFCMRELAASPRCVTLRLLLARALLARHQRKDAAAQLLVALTVTWQAGRLGVNIAKSCQARRATCLRQRHFINLMS